MTASHVGVILGIMPVICVGIGFLAHHDGIKRERFVDASNA